MVKKRHWSDELVCDYDRDATELYALLASLHWDEARLRCQTHPLEARTWVIRRDSSSGKIRWKLLPLHAAVIFRAPMTMIECLLNEYPKAAREQDDKGLLPLHLAFRHKQDDSVLQALLEEYPEGVSTRDRLNRFPIELAGESAGFSIRFIRIYAEAYAKFHGSKQVEASKALNKVKVDSLHNMHKEKMMTLEKEHKQAMRHLKQEMFQEQHSLRLQHEQEMDDLRDMLAREVGSGQNLTKLELELKRLRNCLSDAEAECEQLRGVVQRQTMNQTEVKAQMRKLLADQKMIHQVCKNQQRQLEEAQQFREQILSSLLVKETGKDADKCRDMRELSLILEYRTEQLLS